MAPHLSTVCLLAACRTCEMHNLCKFIILIEWLVANKYWHTNWQHLSTLSVCTPQHAQSPLWLLPSSLSPSLFPQTWLFLTLPDPTCPAPHQHWLGDPPHINTFAQWDIVYTQLCTRHAPLNQHLHRFKCSNIPYCLWQCRNTCIETIHHLLYECLRYKRSTSFWKEHWAEIYTRCQCPHMWKRLQIPSVLHWHNKMLPGHLQWGIIKVCHVRIKHHKQITCAGCSWTSPSQEQPPYPVT